jgi:hypothetical protein
MITTAFFGLGSSVTAFLSYQSSILSQPRIFSRTSSSQTFHNNSCAFESNYDEVVHRFGFSPGPFMPRFSPSVCIDYFLSINELKTASEFALGKSYNRPLL